MNDHFSDDAKAGARKPDFLRGIRHEAIDAPESGIVEVFNYGRNHQGLIPLWVGESDLSTPAFICDAAARSLEAGETFYTHQRGLPELRNAIATYMTGVYGSPTADSTEPFSPERFFITIGGMQALQIAVRLVAGPGDEVLVATPAWPNFRGVLTVGGAHVTEVPMRFEEGAEPHWMLDVADLAGAVTERTRALVVNSPANPTGWIATLDDLRAMLELARRHDLWIIADEIYGRFVYAGQRAPSFHDVMLSSDKVMFVQTLSKNWAMTGWRVGWLEAPEALGDIIENLVQYSSSGVAVPVQRGAHMALAQGEDFLRMQIEQTRLSRDILCDALAGTGRVRFARPAGAFYLFCRFEGEADTRALSLRLVDEAGIGAAPGSAFGRGGEDFLRLCFARSPGGMEEVGRRLVTWLGRSSRPARA